MNGLYTKRIIRLILIIILALAFIIASSLLILTHSRYVTEMGGTGSSIGGQGNDLGNEIMTPFNVGSPLDLFNAISSGYNYVQLSSDLKAPIIMTGDSLDLQANLTLDLNGNEIQRSSRAGLVTVSGETALTIIDTKGGGGLYNPTGNVLAIDGGDLNVFGGKFESGPRAKEYYTNLKTTDGALYSSIPVGAVTPLKAGTPSTMPQLPVRKDASGNMIGGNVYFDQSIGTGGYSIDSDTYCYVAVNEEQLGEVTALDVSEAAFVYSYTYDSQEVTVIGFHDVVETAENTIGSLEGRALYNNFAAVQMQSGKLNVNVNVEGSARASEDGSFYSYFGTQHSACVYMVGGEMDVSTSGTFSTVDPGQLPVGTLAKNSEGSCIISERLRDTASGGVLNIQKLGSAFTYNGSVIAMRGGTLSVKGANFIKKATLSHTDDPRPLDDLSIDKSAMDAAIFMRGGRVSVVDSNFTVEKDLRADSVGKTTYGILARGTNSQETIQTDLTCTDTNFVIHGSDSYGIYATRGDIEIIRGDITITSGTNSFGVYAVNMGTAAQSEGEIGDAVDLNLDSVQINIAKSGYVAGTRDLEFKTYVGEDPEGMGNIIITNPDGTTQTYRGRATSVGVYLNSILDEHNGTKPGGKVTASNVVINSQGMGVAVNGGSLTFKGGATINAYNATAIGVNAGTLNLENSGASYNVNCELNRKSNGVSTSQQFDFSGKESSCSVDSTTVAKNAAENQYAIYVPWQRERNSETGVYTYTGIYENNNAIRVQGGELNCYGNLNLNFRGLYNDYDLYNTAASGDTVYFDNFVIKSFAVACFGGNININRCNIVSAVGGGVKVQGGNIMLGDENNTSADANELIKIETRGRAHLNELIYVAQNLNTATYNGWRFYPNLSGGAAIVSRSGNITVNYGTFNAEFGNAVTATGDVEIAQDTNQRSTITINGGVFSGNLNHSASASHSVTGSGPASHYGVQVMGSADVNIYGGTFDGRNGGLFIRGQQGQANANVRVYEGSFGNKGSQDGINIFEFANVYLGAYTDAELNAQGYTTDAQRRGLIKTWAKFFPIAINPIFTAPSYNGYPPINYESQVNWNYKYNINVYVYYGTYEIGDKQKTRGIGAVDSNIRNFNFYIYNHKTLVSEQAGTNSDLIRYMADDVIRTNTYADFGVHYGYINNTHHYYGDPEIAGVTQNPKWVT